MPSSFTPSLRFNLQASGENLSLWGVLFNDGVFSLADTAIAGFATVPLTGNYTLTSSNGVADEARSAMLKFTGTLAVNAVVTIPAVSKTYLVWNATNKAVTLTTGGATTVAVDSGDKVLVFSDGTAVMTPGYGGLSLKDYITAFTASAGAVPSPIGNEGKYLFSDGTNVIWREPATADLSDYQTAIVEAQIANAAALAIVFGRR